MRKELNEICQLAKAKRSKTDFYQTPYNLTRLLLQNETFQGSILEPACGQNAIVDILQEKYSDITAQDIEKDFLLETNHYDNIITNPPYRIANDFILKAKELANRKIAMLMPLNYLHGNRRFNKIWKDSTFPLARVLVFVRYCYLNAEKRETAPGGMLAYAWFIFDKEHKGETTLSWLDNNIRK